MALNQVRPRITDDITLALNVDGQNIDDLDVRVTTLEQSIQSAVFGNPPGAPTSIVVSTGTASVTVSCTPPTDIGNSAIRSILYVLLPLGISAQGTPDGSAVTFQQVPSVDQNGNAINYQVQAAAENAGGYGQNSTPSASFAVAAASVSASVPGTMPAPTASNGAAGQMFVQFPIDYADGGSAITLYRVTASDGTSNTGTASPIAISGLQATGTGTPYTATVAALNGIGWSTESNPSNSVTVTPTFSNPDPPQGTPTVNLSGTTATVSFIAPANTGNSAISQYTASLTGGGSTIAQQGTGSPLIVSGLTPGTTYTGTITDLNAAGYVSGPSAPFTFTTAGAAAGTNALPHGADNTSGGQAAYRVNLLPGYTGNLPSIGGSSGLFGSTNLYMRLTAASTSPYTVGPRALVKVTPGGQLSGLVRVRTSAPASVAPRIDWCVGGEGGSNVNPVTVASFSYGTTVTTVAATDQALAFSLTVPSGVTYALVDAALLSAPTIGDTFDVGEFEIAIGAVTTWSVGTGSHELVVNPSAATDATNATVTATSTSISIARVTGLTAPADGFAGTTAFQIDRATNGTDTFAHANFALNSPTSINVGSKVVVSGWFRALIGTPFAVGMLVADANDANQISADATYPYLTDGSWHRFAYSTTATAAGVTGDTFFLVLPLTGVFRLQVTNLTIATT